MMAAEVNQKLITYCLWAAAQKLVHAMTSYSFKDARKPNCGGDSRPKMDSSVIIYQISAHKKP